MDVSIDRMIEVSREAREHAARHGFVEHEDFPGALVYWTPERQAAFYVKDERTATVLVNVVSATRSLALWEVGMDHRRPGSAADEAEFLDQVEEALVRAKRMVRDGS